MFDRQRFIDDCKTAFTEGQKAIREVVAKVVSDPASIIREMGEPADAGIVPLYRSKELTIMHFTWAPYMTLVPHNHNMFSVVGIYYGREDNMFWRRTEGTIEIASGKSLAAGEVATLGRDIIHSVINPIGKRTSAFHVYGGDFLAPDDRRSQWDHESLMERPWNLTEVKHRFGEFDARYKVWAEAMVDSEVGADYPAGAAHL